MKRNKIYFFILAFVFVFLGFACNLNAPKIVEASDDNSGYENVQQKANGKYVAKPLNDGDGIAASVSIRGAYFTASYFHVEAAGRLDNNSPVTDYCSTAKYIEQEFYMYSNGERHNGHNIYMFRLGYSIDLHLDITDVSPNVGAKLQVYQAHDNTPAQKFVVKEVYWVDLNGVETYKGLLIFTGASNYTKVLQMDWPKGITQQNLCYADDQLMEFDYDFTDYISYESGYHMDGRSDIDYLYNRNGDVFDSESIWENYSHLISVKSLEQSHTRISPNGLSAVGEAKMKFRLESPLSSTHKYGLFNWSKATDEIVNQDQANSINGVYTGGTLGKGIMSIIYTDSAGQTATSYIRNYFSGEKAESTICESSKTDFYNYTNETLTLNKVGFYTIRVNYRFRNTEGNDKYNAYFTKIFTVTILPSSDDAFVMSAEKADTVLSTYDLCVSNNDVIIKNNGSNVNATTKLAILENITKVNKEKYPNEYKTAIENLIAKIQKFKHYKVCYTNASFYISSAGNPYMTIAEQQIGANETVPNSYISYTKNNSANAQYTYVTKNYYSSNYGAIVVYHQSVPVEHYFRNVTYTYLDDKNQLVNYAMDYFVLECQQSYPEVPVLEQNYTIEIDGTTSAKTEFKSGKIYYNLTNKIENYIFESKDIAGNTTKTIVRLLPASTPQVNLNSLLKNSNRAKTSGYLTPVYNQQKACFENYLYSTFSVASQKLMSSIMESDVCTKTSSGGYTLNFTLDGKTIQKTFSSNTNLTTYLNQLCDEEIEYYVIDPTKTENILIDELDMLEDVIYLNKNFAFSSDKNIPLFESSKIQFSYYSNNVLQKSGTIVYDGQYSYGDTLFKILADNKEENWKEGYVQFKEYNLFANSGISYTGYIVKSAPEVVINYKSEGIGRRQNIIENTTISADSFSIADVVGDSQSITIIEFDGTKTRYSITDLKNIEFTEVGTYNISVYNRNGYCRKFSVNITEIQIEVQGAENMSETSESVVIMSLKNNFDIYINGLKISKITYKSGSYYCYKIDNDYQKDVVIVQDGKIFAFKINSKVIQNAKDYSEITENELTITESRALYKIIKVYEDKFETYNSVGVKLFEEYDSIKNDVESTIQNVENLISKMIYGDLLSKLSLVKTYKQDLNLFESTIVEIWTVARTQNEAIISEDLSAIEKAESLVKKYKELKSQYSALVENCTANLQKIYELQQEISYLESESDSYLQITNDETKITTDFEIFINNSTELIKNYNSKTFDLEKAEALKKDIVNLIEKIKSDLKEIDEIQSNVYQTKLQSIKEKYDEYLSQLNKNSTNISLFISHYNIMNNDDYFKYVHCPNFEAIKKDKVTLPFKK